MHWALSISLVFYKLLCRYLVFSDPPGAKIGCGGATMYVLEQLQKIIPQEELSKGTCMWILIVVYAVVARSGLFLFDVVAQNSVLSLPLHSMYM